MKISRDATIGGQPAKLVRDLLADATNSDGFYSDLVDKHLLRAWWRSTIDALVEAGEIDRHNRSQALRDWTTARDREEIFGVRLPKAPNLSAQPCNLIEALLAHDLIREDDQERDGRVVYGVTEKGDQDEKLLSRG